jgi:hypothetical protein
MLLRAFKPGMMVGMMGGMGGKGTLMDRPWVSMTGGLRMAMQGMIGGHRRAMPGMPVGRLQLDVICDGMPPRGGPSGTGDMPKSRLIFLAFLPVCTLFGRPALSQCMEAQEMGTLLRG